MWKTNSDGATSYYVDGKLVASYYNGAKMANGRKELGRWANVYGEYPHVYVKRSFVSLDYNEAYVKKLILSWLVSTP